MPSLLLPRADVLKLDSGKMYFVQNNTSKPLVLPDGRTPLLRYARIPYPVDPGEKELVPFDVVSLYFGDPRSRNGMIQKFKDSRGEGMIQSREAELGRIAVFWGVYEQGVDTLISVVPDVQITTLNGQEIIPPCFDPYGEYTYGFEKGPIDTQMGAASAIAAMQEQMDQMKAMMDAMRAGGDNDADVPEDLPPFPQAGHPAMGGVTAPSSP
jgi:hypothetical protein